MQPCRREPGSSRSVCASNAVGTINPVAEVVRRAHAVGALTYVDAVHFAPHGPIDVAELGTDFLVCSAYKFFGPHAGILYARGDLFETLPAYKVRPAHHRFETGTGNFEGIAGIGAAVDYLASVGERFGDRTGAGRRERILAGMRAIRGYELELYGRLADGLDAIRGVRVLGITERSRFDERCPTASIVIDGVAPRTAAEALGRQGIAVWDGDFYATSLVERLGHAESGGVLRIGLVHYNTAAEVDRLLGALEADRLRSRCRPRLTSPSSVAASSAPPRPPSSPSAAPGSCSTNATRSPPGRRGGTRGSSSTRSTRPSPSSTSRRSGTIAGSRVSICPSSPQACCSSESTWTPSGA